MSLREGYPESGAADDALFPVALARRRHPHRHAAAGGLMGDRCGRGPRLRLDRRRHRLSRLSRRPHGGHGRAAGGKWRPLTRSRLAEARRPARRGREPAGARPEFVRGQAHRTHVPAGPARTARRDRRRARRRSEGRNPSPLKHQEAAAPASPTDALGAIQAFGPPTPAGAGAGEARAYAPLSGLSVEPRAVKPHPVDEQGETSSALAGGAASAG